eukprot:scaffold2709_cov122-Isochrysis_galbana.AAC.2
MTISTIHHPRRMPACPPPRPRTPIHHAAPCQSPHACHAQIVHGQTAIPSHPCTHRPACTARTMPASWRATAASHPSSPPLPVPIRTARVCRQSAS